MGNDHPTNSSSGKNDDDATMPRDGPLHASSAAGPAGVPVEGANDAPSPHEHDVDGSIPVVDHADDGTAAAEEEESEHHEVAGVSTQTPSLLGGRGARVRAAVDCGSSTASRPPSPPPPPSGTDGEVPPPHSEPAGPVLPVGTGGDDASGHRGHRRRRPRPPPAVPFFPSSPASTGSFRTAASEAAGDGRGWGRSSACSSHTCRSVASSTRSSTVFDRLYQTGLGTGGGHDSPSCSHEHHARREALAEKRRRVAAVREAKAKSRAARLAREREALIRAQRDKAEEEKVRTLQARAREVLDRQERAKRERAAMDRQERAAREKVAKEKVAREKAAREKAAKERAAKARIAKEKERAAMERITKEKERAAKEKAERERAESTAKERASRGKPAKHEAKTAIAAAELAERVAKEGGTSTKTKSLGENATMEEEGAESMESSATENARRQHAGKELSSKEVAGRDAEVVSAKEATIGATANADRRREPAKKGDAMARTKQQVATSNESAGASDSSLPEVAPGVPISAPSSASLSEKGHPNNMGPLGSVQSAIASEKETPPTSHGPPSSRLHIETGGDGKKTTGSNGGDAAIAAAGSASVSASTLASSPPTIEPSSTTSTATTCTATSIATASTGGGGGAVVRGGFGSVGGGGPPPKKAPLSVFDRLYTRGRESRSRRDAAAAAARAGERGGLCEEDEDAASVRSAASSRASFASRGGGSVAGGRRRRRHPPPAAVSTAKGAVVSRGNEVGPVATTRRVITAPSTRGTAGDGEKCEKSHPKVNSVDGDEVREVAVARPKPGGDGCTHRPREKGYVAPRVSARSFMAETSARRIIPLQDSPGATSNECAREVEPPTSTKRADGARRVPPSPTEPKTAATTVTLPNRGKGALAATERHKTTPPVRYNRLRHRREVDVKTSPLQRQRHATTPRVRNSAACASPSPSTSRPTELPPAAAAAAAPTSDYDEARSAMHEVYVSDSLSNLLHAGNGTTGGPHRPLKCVHEQRDVDTLNDVPKQKEEPRETDEGEGQEEDDFHAYLRSAFRESYSAHVREETDLQIFVDAEARLCSPGVDFVGSGFGRIYELEAEGDPFLPLFAPPSPIWAPPSPRALVGALSPLGGTEETELVSRSKPKDVESLNEEGSKVFACSSPIFHTDSKGVDETEDITSRIDDASGSVSRPKGRADVDTDASPRAVEMNEATWTDGTATKSMHFVCTAANSHSTSFASVIKRKEFYWKHGDATHSIDATESASHFEASASSTNVQKKQASISSEQAIEAVPDICDAVGGVDRILFTQRPMDYRNVLTTSMVDEGEEKKTFDESEEFADVVGMDTATSTDAKEEFTLEDVTAKLRACHLSFGDVWFRKVCRGDDLRPFFDAATVARSIAESRRVAENAAARDIQRIFRGYLALSELARLSVVASIIVIQMAYRRYRRRRTCGATRKEMMRLGTPELACTAIQRFWRGTWVRIICERKRTCAVIIQCAWRDFVAFVILARETVFRSVVVIQTAVRRRMTALRYLKARTGISVLQGIVRGAIFRSAIDEVASHEGVISADIRGHASGRVLSQHQAAITIESAARSFLSKNECYRLREKERERMSARSRAIVTIQSFSRRSLCRMKQHSSLLTLQKDASTQIQRTWRSGKRQQQSARTNLVIQSRQNAAASIIQRRHRYCIKRRQHIVSLQKFLRVILAKRRFLQVLRWILLLQAEFRGFLVRQQLRKQSVASTLIQAGYRSWRLQLLAHKMLSLILIQRVCRSYVSLCRWRQQKAAAILLQRSIRGLLQRRSFATTRRFSTLLQASTRCMLESNRFRRQCASLLLIQNVYRGAAVRGGIQIKHIASMHIQRVWRRQLLAKERLLFAAEGATALQRNFRMRKQRGWYRKQQQSAKLVRLRYLSWKKRLRELEIRAAVLIQSVWRMHARACLMRQTTIAARLIQGWVRGVMSKLIFKETIRRVVLLQALARCMLASSMFHQQYNSILLMQKTCRGATVRIGIKSKCTAATKLQRKWKGCCARKRAVLASESATMLQAQFRMRTEWRLYRKQQRTAKLIQWRYHMWKMRSIERKIHSLVFIQTVWRRHAAASLIRRKVVATKLIQRNIRGFICTYKFKETVRCVTLLQAWARSILALELYSRQRKCLLLLQSTLRGLIVRREIQKQHSSSIVVQCLWRAAVARSLYANTTVRVVTIQSLLRRMRARMRFSTARNGIVLSQGLARGVLARRSLWVAGCAASIIERFWRKSVAQRQFLFAVHSIVRIQAHYRMHIHRLLHGLYITSAETIQGRYRRWRLEVAEREIRSITLLQSNWRRCLIAHKLHGEDIAAALIQAEIRRSIAQRGFREASSCIAIIQAHVRGMLALRCSRELKEKERRRKHAAAVKIQAFSRRALAQRKEGELPFSVINDSSAAKLQKIWRGYVLRKGYIKIRRMWRENLLRKRYTEAHQSKQIESARTIQQCYNSWTRRKHIVLQSSAVAEIQCAWRRKKAQKNKYSIVVLASTKIQAEFRRACHAMKYARSREATIKIQSSLRGKRAQKQLRSRLHAAIMIQQTWRGVYVKSKFSTCIGSSTRVQSCIRGMIVRRCYHRALRGVIALQRVTRGVQSRESLVLCHFAASEVQRVWIGQKERTMYHRKVASIVTIQSYQRRVVACLRFHCQRQACLTVQRMMRGTLTRLNLVLQHLAASEVQRIWRGYRTECCYISTLLIVIKLQATVRKAVALKRQNAAAIQRRACLTVQRMMRGMLTRLDLDLQHLAAYEVQRIWRGYHTECCYMSTLLLVIKLQATVRGTVARNMLKRQKAAAIQIQSIIWRVVGRNRLVSSRFGMNVRSAEYFSSSGAADRIEAIVRAPVYCRKTTGHICLIQCAVRRYLARKKAAATIQGAAQTLLMKKYFARKPIVLQCLVHKYFTRKHAASVIQSFARSVLVKNQLGRTDSLDRGNQALLEFNAVKIQALIRRWSCEEIYVRKQAAARHVQICFFSWKTRIMVYKVKAAAVRLQSAMRGYLARTFVQIIRMELQAVTLIQSRLRRFLAQVALSYSTEEGFSNSSSSDTVSVSSCSMESNYEIEDSDSITSDGIEEGDTNNVKVQRNGRMVLVNDATFDRARRNDGPARSEEGAQMRHETQSENVRNGHINAPVDYSARTQNAVFGQETKRTRLSTTESATVIQTFWRMSLLSSDYINAKASTVLMQGCIRGWFSCRNYAKQRNSSILLQSFVRVGIAKNKVAARQHAAIMIQWFFRWHKSREIAKHTFLREEEASILLQSIWRASLCSSNYARSIDSAVVIQKWVRAVIHFRHYRKLRVSSAVIQSIMRVRIAAKERVARKASAVLVQRVCRGYHGQQTYRYTLSRILKVQTTHRMVVKRIGYRATMAATKILQRYYRCWVSRCMLKNAKMSVKVLQKGTRKFLVRCRIARATITIQSAFRLFVGLKLFSRTKRNIVFLQCVMRQFVARHKFLMGRKRAIIIQRKWRFVARRLAMSRKIAAELAAKDAARLAVLEEKKLLANFRAFAEREAVLLASNRDADCLARVDSDVWLTARNLAAAKAKYAGVSQRKALSRTESLRSFEVDARSDPQYAGTTRNGNRWRDYASGSSSCFEGIAAHHCSDVMIGVEVLAPFASGLKPTEEVLERNFVGEVCFPKAVAIDMYDGPKARHRRKEGLSNEYFTQPTALKDSGHKMDATARKGDRLGGSSGKCSSDQASSVINGAPSGGVNSDAVQLHAERVNPPLRGRMGATSSEHCSGSCVEGNKCTDLEKNLDLGALIREARIAKKVSKGAKSHNSGCSIEDESALVYDGSEIRFPLNKRITQQHVAVACNVIDDKDVIEEDETSMSKPPLQEAPSWDWTDEW